MSEEEALGALGPWTALCEAKSNRATAGTSSRKRKSSASSSPRH